MKPEIIFTSFERNSAKWLEFLSYQEQGIYCNKNWFFIYF